MKDSSDKKKSFVETILIPDYDELALYSMSYICFLLFLINNPPNQWNFSIAEIELQEFELVLLFLVFIVGMLLSFYHAFSKRRKTIIEKQLMLIFAAFICGFSGIWGGTYMLSESIGWLAVFPIWNIFSGMWLLAGVRSREINEDNISDENVELIEVLIGTVIISTIFFICYFGFKLNWAATFSICIAWATTFSSSINSIVVSE